MSNHSSEKIPKRRKALRKAVVASTLIPLCLLAHEARAAVSIIISGVADLNFGVVTENGAGGTVVVTPGGSRSTTGGVTGVSGGAFVSQGSFAISGSTGLAIDLSMTSPNYTVSNGSANMVVNNFNLLTNAGGSVATVTLAVNPSIYTLGASLVVVGGQAEGTYIGSYVVSANYQ